jgi:hypothetical protein
VIRDEARWCLFYMAGETHAHAFTWHCSIISCACCLGARTPPTTFPPRLCAISITPTSSFSRLPFTAQGTPPPLCYTPHRVLFRPSKPSGRHAAISFHQLPSPRTTPPPPSGIRKFLHQHRSTTHKLSPRWSASPQLPASSVSSRNLTQLCAPSPCTG